MFGLRITQQIGEQRARGVELAASRLACTLSLQLMGDVTFLDDEYVEFNENQGNRHHFARR